MAMFSTRPFGYKVGLFLILLSVVCYITGFSSPYWTLYQATFEKGDGMNLSDPYFFEELRGHNGLWETCDIISGYSVKMCAPISFHAYPAWVHGVQGLQCIGLVGLIAAFGYAGAINFVLPKPSINNRYLEILLLLSGIFGFTGSTIYAAESYGNDQVLLVEGDYYSDFNWMYDEDNFLLGQNDLAWAYVVNLMGCLLALVSAVVICAFNRYILQENPRHVAGVSFSAAGAAVGGGLVFLPPERLAGGFYPPPYTSQDPTSVGNQQNGASSYDGSCVNGGMLVLQEEPKVPL